MKKSLILAAGAIAPGCLIAFVDQFTSSNTLSFPTLFGTIVGGSLLFLAIGDYTRKTRFRVGLSRKEARLATTPATSSEIDPASVWTYTTVSA